MRRRPARIPTTTLLLGLALSGALVVSTSQAQSPAEPETALPQEQSTDEAPPRLGPLRLETSAGSLEFAYRIQLQGDLVADGSTDGELRIRRSRPQIRAAFFEERLRFTLQLNVAPASFEIIEAYADGTPTDGIDVRVGYAKLPFGHRWMDSSARLAFVDWPRVVTVFGGRALQAGVQGGSIDGPSGLEWAVAVTTGDAARPSNGQSLPQRYGMDRRHRLDLRGDAAPIDTPHPELVARLRWRLPRSVLSFSALYDARPKYRFDDLLRGAIEWEGLFGNLSLHGGAFAMASRDFDDALMVSQLGALAEAVVHIGPTSIGLRYDAVLTTAALRRDIREDALARANRYPDQAPQLAILGRDRGEHELTGAFAWRFVGHSLKWTTDASYLVLEGNTEAFRLRSQVQLAF